MKIKSVLILIVAAVVVVGFVSIEAGIVDLNTGFFEGAGIMGPQETTIEKVAKSPGDFLGKEVKLEGKLVKSVERDEFEEAYFLVDDQGFFVPLNLPYEDVRMYEVNGSYSVKGSVEEKTFSGGSYLFINVSEANKN